VMGLAEELLIAPQAVAVQLVPFCVRAQMTPPLAGSLLTIAVTC
jgi:hypothetical protein